MSDIKNIKFIMVEKLPQENIDENAVYVVGNDDYAFVDGKWENIGHMEIRDSQGRRWD